MSLEADVAQDWEAVGLAIRSRRQGLGLTLLDLAAAVALSQPFLSQIENGRARPSMASLYRISRALGTTPQALFAGDFPAGTGAVVVRAGDVGAVPVDESGAAGAVRVLLAGAAPLHVLEFDGLPDEFLDTWEHDGFEAVYVLSGDVDVEVGGEVSRLGSGDLVSYPASTPHRLRAAGAAPARVLLIETTAQPAHRVSRPG